MKTIVKLLERMMPKLEYVGNFGTEVYNGTWTAPADGILLAHGQWNNSGTAAYWQITDQTDNHMVMSMATTNANQHQWEFGIPVLKGHEYYTSSAMALKTANAYFYRLTWGGYCITLFISTVLSHLAERWWEYEDPEENPRQNATNFGQLGDAAGFVTWCGLQILWGSNTQAVSSAQDRTWDTTFNRQFAYTPVVFAQVVETTGVNMFSVVVTNITKTGCRFIRRSTASTSYNCQIVWLAIGKAA